MGDILDSMLGYSVIPDILSAYIRELHTCLMKDGKTNDILDLHHKHFEFLYKNIKNKQMFEYAGIEGNVFYVKNMLIGLLQFCKAANNPTLRPMLTKILDGLITPEDVVGLFPYDCKHDNLGVYDGKVIMRDAYYVRDAYSELEEIMEEKWANLLDEHNSIKMVM